MYKQYKNLDGVVGGNVIVRLADNAFIPFDPDNVDFQAYQQWLAEGNEPLPADAPVQNP